MVGASGYVGRGVWQVILCRVFKGLGFGAWHTHPPTHAHTWCHGVSPGGGGFGELKKKKIYIIKKKNPTLITCLGGVCACVCLVVCWLSYTLKELLLP